MESTLPAIEVLVRVLEIVCEDAGVRGDIAAKIHRIEFTTQGAMADVEVRVVWVRLCFWIVCCLEGIFHVKLSLCLW
jgi:hypothetical protein